MAFCTCAHRSTLKYVICNLLCQNKVPRKAHLRNCIPNGLLCLFVLAPHLRCCPRTALLVDLFGSRSGTQKALHGVLVLLLDRCDLAPRRPPLWVTALLSVLQPAGVFLWPWGGAISLAENASLRGLNSRRISPLVILHKHTCCP